MSYTEHNDRANLEQRLRVLTNKAERARLASLQEERDFGAITLFMSRHELKARLAEAVYARQGLPLDAPRVARMHADGIERREREFHRSNELEWRAQHENA